MGMVSFIRPAAPQARKRTPCITQSRVFMFFRRVSALGDVAFMVFVLFAAVL